MRSTSINLAAIVILLAFREPLIAEEQSDYIEPVTGDIVIRPSVNYNQLSFLIFDQTDQNSTLVTYRPNSTVYSRFDIGYKNFGLAGSFKIPGSEKDSATHGETTATDYQLYYYAQKFGVDVFHQTYKGFYSELGTTNVSTVSTTTGRGVREDLAMTNVGGNVYYVFSDQFSLRAAFRQTERQKKTGFSILMGASASYYTIAADRSLVPFSHEAAFAEYSGYTGGRYANFSLFPGFGVTYLPKERYYMTFFVLMGAGVTQATVDTSAGQDIQITDNYKVNAKYGAGYNGDVFFTGATIVLDLSAASTFSKSTLNVGSGVIFFELFAGARFDV